MADSVLPSQIAPDVYVAAAGPRTNVYFVRSGASWGLIDAGWHGRAEPIKAQAEAVFGHNAQPAAIFLTHIHPDHNGSALPLAQTWGVPVVLHPAELPMAGPDYPREYAHPVDRRIMAVTSLIRRATPRRMRERARARSDMRGVVRALDPRGELPELPGWECVPTPGHTPGHVAFYRRSDGVLITGDAVGTIDMNSVLGVVFGALRLSGPARTSPGAGWRRSNPSRSWPRSSRGYWHRATVGRWWAQRPPQRCVPSPRNSGRTRRGPPWIVDEPRAVPVVAPLHPRGWRQTGASSTGLTRAFSRAVGFDP